MQSFVFSNMFRALKSILDGGRRTIPPLLIFGITVLFIAGCGSGVNASNTQTVILLSGTANDQLLSFNLIIASLTLTNSEGNVVNIISAPQVVEAIHSNGTAEPIASVSIPQDTYTSATILYSYASFSLPALAPGLIVQTYNSIFVNGASGSATAILPSAITIGSEPTLLSLNIVASKSISITNSGPGPTYVISPVFEVTTSGLGTPPTNEANGKESDVYGEITSAPGVGEFNLATTDGATVTVSTNDGTQYQGISTLGGVAAASSVDADLVINPNGSLTATRLEVQDAATQDRIIGPLIPYSGLVGDLAIFFRQQQGGDFSDDVPLPGTITVPFQASNNTVFQISGRSVGYVALPFSPVFSIATAIPGQTVAVTADFNAQTGIISNPTTVALVPQTINGVVSAVASVGGNAVYVLTLAPNDFLTLMDGVSQVLVYTQPSTQALTSSPVATGSPVRANGLLFNDSGTLRLVCGQISDGVTE